MKNVTPILLSLLFIFSNSINAQYVAPTRISNNTDIFDSPSQLLTGDMDNDGDIDLVSNNPANGNLVWFENLDGNGKMDDPKVINSLNHLGVNLFHLHDVDGNGTIDVIGVENQQVFWYKNTITNTATFSDEIYLPNQDFTSVYEFNIEDMDGDNILDIVMIGHPMEIGWMKGIDNQGNFEPYASLSFDGRYHVRVSDLDGDGDMDMVTPHYDNGDWNLVWVSNTDGNANLSSPNIINALIESPQDLKIADLDGDGDDDILLATYTGFYLAYHYYWYENQLNQGGSWVQNTISDTTLMAPPLIYDIDTDGDLDLVTSYGGNGGFIVFENSNGSGDFIQHDPMNIYGGKSMNNVDINNDGIQDIVSVYTTSTVNQELGLIYIGRDDQTFENPIDYIGDADNTSYDGVLEAKDLNGDGIKDLISSHDNVKRLDWQSFDNSELKFTNPRIIGQGQSIGIDFADFDGDGDEDIVTINDDSYGDNVILFENINGEINYGAAKVLDSGDYAHRNIQAGDLDNDGDVDIFFNKPGGGFGGGIFWLENLDGQANFSARQELISMYFDHAQLEDMDQDGDLDILGHDSNPEGIHWFENNGGAFSAPELVTDDQDIGAFLFEDVDGNGWKDILFTDDNNLVSLRKNTGSTLGFDAPIILPGLNPGASSLPQLFLRDGDLDGDNDLYMYSNSWPNFILYYFENIGGQNIFASAQLIYTFQNKPSKISIDDYDGDLDMDIVVHSGINRTLEFIENYFDKPSISGKVFFDENENGDFDNNENLIYPLSIMLEPDALATFSSYLGNFHFAVVNGIYDVTCNMSSNFGFTTPSTIQAEVTDDSDVEIFYGIKTLVAEAGVLVSNASAPTRCGFEVPFWIDYQNTGTVIGNVIISFEIDSLANFISSSPMPDSIVGNTIYWSHENLPITHSGQINLILQMPGVEFIGEYLTFISSAELTSLDGNHTDLRSTAYRPQLNCAYDPNDKLVEPQILGHPNYTLFGDTLKYTVRFQNTGTDTAFTVRIEDYLDVNLEYSSLQVIGASHPYEVTLDENTGRMMFHFENILLPDSSANEVESHGYFQYQIRHKSNLSENTYIQNYASIFFDFNPPIITNTVENILVSQYPLLVDLTHPSCNGDSDGTLSITYGLPIFDSILWSTGATGLAIDSLGEGQYDLTINYLDGTQLDTSFVIVNPFPIEIINPILEHVSCFNANDGSIELELIGGTPNFFYQWTNGLSGLVNDQLAPGNYQLTVTDINGCSTQDSFNITGPDELIVLGEVNNISCYGLEDGSIIPYVQGGVPNYSFLWSNWVFTEDQYDLPAGDYSLTVTDDNFCKDTIYFTVSSPSEILIEINTTPVSDQQMNGAIEILPSGGTPPFSYSWDFDSSEISNFVDSLGQGIYTVTITDANNCSIIETISVELETNIENLKKDISFTLSPNPNLGNFKVEFDLKNKLDWEIQIFNYLGQNIQSKNSALGGSTREEIDFELNKGYYNIILLVDGKIIKVESVMVL